MPSCRLPDDGRRYEPVEGRLFSEPLPSFGHGRVAVRIASLLNAHARANGVGAVVAGDAGFVLSRSPDTVRGPDVVFVSASNRPGEIHGKIADHLAAGARRVWVVGPETRTVGTYRTLLAPGSLSVEDLLDAEEVLPGFRIHVSDLFEACRGDSTPAGAEELGRRLDRECVTTRLSSRSSTRASRRRRGRQGTGSPADPAAPSAASDRSRSTISTP